MARVDVVPWSIATRWSGKAPSLYSWSMTLCALSGRFVLARVRHEVRQRLAFLWREAQAKLAATPQHIVYILRPFVRHQVVHFGGGEIGAETDAKLFEAVDVTDHALDAGAICAREPADHR